MANTIGEAIEEAGRSNVQSASSDGTSVTQIPIPDLIQADKYTQAKAAGASRRLPFFAGRIRPPGAV
jgi:hypothetical protein